MWYSDLCHYYQVTPERAIELGQRAKGRRPNLPGSRSCEPISGKTWEDLWDLKPRETLAQKIAFYDEIGSWQSFRQCSYRSTFDYGAFLHQMKNRSNFLEYGCGVAPFSNYILERCPEKLSATTLVDVPSEHLRFGEWRINRKSKLAGDVEVKIIQITPEKVIPEFDSKFDFVSMMDVLEHLPNPFDVMGNIFESCNKGAILIETWVEHEHGPEGADLEEAEEEREITMDLIKQRCEPLGVLYGAYRLHRVR